MIKKITYDLIYNMILENGIDVKIKSNKRLIVDHRYVYFYLCQKFLHTSLERIGLSLATETNPKGFSHATVLHGIREFKINIGKDYFYANKSFLENNKKLSKLYCDNIGVTDDFSIDFKNENEVDSFYKIKYYNELRHYRKEVDRLKKQILKSA